MKSQCGITITESVETQTEETQTEVDTEYDSRQQQLRVNTLTPVPIQEILAESNKGRSQVRTFTIESYYQVNREGQLHLHVMPNCMETFLMLPFPFFCLGCCFSYTTDLLFDDDPQLVHIRYSWGHFYLFPCLQSRSTWSYDDIGNIGYYHNGVEQDGVLMYCASLIMKNGKIFPFAPPMPLSDVHNRTLAMHYFIFGRNSPNYSQPFPTSLYISTM
eukprot:gene10094-11175_t